MATYPKDRAMPLPFVTPHDPDGVDTYEFDLVGDIATGEAISGTPTVTSTPTGLTVNNIVVSGTKVQFRVTGGTAGRAYTVACVASTDTNSHVKPYSGVIQVSER